MKKKFIICILTLIISSTSANSILTFASSNVDKSSKSNIENIIKDSNDNMILLRKANPNIDIFDYISDEYYESKDSIATYGAKNKDVLIHNNGKPIKTNVLVEKNGYELIAVHKYINDNYDYAEYFYSTENKNNINIIKDNIKNNDLMGAKGISTNNTQNSKEAPIFRKSNWNYNWNGSKYYTMTDSLTFERKSKSANYNGKKVSVWDITSVGQIKGARSGTRINNQYTRMSAEAFGSQSLIDYGPSVNSGGNLSVSLDGLVPKLSWGFNLGNWKTQDLSSLYSNYGRWKFTGPAFGMSQIFTSKPGVRMTNGRGNFGLEVSHTHATNHGDFRTGVSQYFVPDR